MGAFSNALGCTIGAIGYQFVVGGDWSFTWGLAIGAWLPLVSYLISYWLKRRAA